MNLLMEEMTWKELEAKLKETKTVIIPFGSTEEHGYHLPLSTDCHIAHELAKRVGTRTSALVAPPLCYGVCRRSEPFPGTITVGLDTLRSLAVEVAESLYSQGLKNMVFLPGHLGSAQLVSLELSARELLRRHSDLKLAIIRLTEILKELPAGLIDEPFGHGGEVETSIMLALAPQYVRMEEATAETPSFPPHLFGRDSRRFMKSGIIGDATKATHEKGEVILELFVKEISKVVWQLEQGDSE